MTLPDCVEPGDSLFVKVDRRSMLASGIEDICLRPQSAGQRCLVVQFAGNGESSLGQAQRVLDVHSDLLAHVVGELSDEFRLKQGRMLREELAPAGVSGRPASCSNNCSWLADVGAVT